jgi:hypothetical protein
MSGSLEVVERQIQRSLVEVLNSEISQRVIGSLDDAVDWIKISFLVESKRILSTMVFAVDRKQLLAHRSDSSVLIQCVVCKLTRSSRAMTSATSIDTNAASHIMSQRLVEFDAMQKIVSLPFDPSQCRLLTAPSEFTGLQGAVLRTNLEGPPGKVRVQTPCAAVRTAHYYLITIILCNLLTEQMIQSISRFLILCPLAMNRRSSKFGE